MFRPLRKVMAERNEHISKLKADTSEAQNRFDSINSQIKDQEILSLKAKSELQKKNNIRIDDAVDTCRDEVTLKLPCCVVVDDTEVDGIAAFRVRRWLGIVRRRNLTCIR